MKRLYIFVEGQTEESFVKMQLRDYIMNIGEGRISTVVPLLIPKKKGANARKNKGGFNPRTGYHIILDFVIRKLKEDTAALYSTMFDYYAFPADCPALATSKAETDIYKKAKIIEDQMKQDVDHIGHSIKFFPYIQMHEFEALLFSDVQAFETSLGVTESQRKALYDVQKEFTTPEHINDSPKTAPSKILEKIIPGYQKTVDGINTLSLIRVDRMREKCSHFNQWLSILENAIKE